jgi:prepilin-type N-terminal cleavage/methylation domain-containing protein
MYRSSNRSGQGFTIVELLIALAVTVVIVAAAVLMFTNSVQSSTRSLK